MVIDSHVHLVDRGWIHEDFFVGMARIVTAAIGKQTGERPDPQPIMDKLVPALADPTGEKLVASMDAAGVDRSCIFAVDYALLTGEPGVPIEEQNRMIADAAKRFPGRLLPFFTVDPRREGAHSMFRVAVEAWGMRGLKLHPAAGYFASDRVCYPLYELCVEYGIPVLIHTGSQPAPMKSRFARPAYVDDVAADFPGLPIIMAHVGHSWWQEALLIAGVKPNVYFDFSGWQIVFKEHPADFYRMLRRIIDDVGPWRVFFGTDGPYLNVMCPLDKWVEAVREPDLSLCPDVSFSNEEKEIILGSAFARLLHL